MGRVFCSSDWHGCWDPAYKVIEYLKPDDILYFLGDSTDRNPDGVKIFQTLMNRPNTFYIKGNHDEMMARCIPALYEDNMYNYSNLSLWYSNGGDKTAAALEHLSKEDAYKIKKQIDEMPTEVIYTSLYGHTVIMEHAGYTPFNIPHRSHDPLWDRGHFHDTWGNSKKGQNVYLVHGHTPVQYLKYYYGYQGDKPLTIEDAIEKRKFMSNEETDVKPEVIKYCEGHKFNIDMCTVASGRIALIDLDTFEIIYFDKE